MPDISIDYAVAGPTIRRFHKSDAFVRCIIGPIGSGKSTACCVELLRRAGEQKPGPDGIKRSRAAVIRNTYGELRATTLKTWEMWAPFELGRINYDAPITLRIQREGFDLEVMFIALDRDEDLRKLLSLELSFSWLNEAREIPKGILDTLTGRVGRYPSATQGGCTWSGVVADSNASDTESWLYRTEEEKPEGFEFFHQPAGDGPHAENLNWLNQTAETALLPIDHPERLARGRLYYERTKSGKSDDWIGCYIRAEPTFLVEGKPVFPMWRDSVHRSREPLEATPVLPLLIGADFGLTPAAVIGQRLVDGRWWIIDELVTDDCGVIRFAELLKAYVAQHYPGFQCAGWGDPAGTQRMQTDERTCLQIMKKHTPWKWHPAPDNAIAMRLEAVRNALNRMVDGQPGFLLSPKCSMLRKGFAGGYCYKLVRTGNGTTYHETPDKNAYSHPHDGLQYLLSGGGESLIVLRKPRGRNRGPTVADLNYPVFTD